MQSMASTALTFVKEADLLVANGHMADMPAETQAAMMRYAIREYAAGTPPLDIATKLGISGPTMYRYLIKHYEQDWKDIQAGKALAALDEAEEELRDAQSMAEVSRAGTRIRAEQWKLERVLSRIYAAKQEVHHSGDPIINITVVQSSK